jgi:hypothetical protein
MKSTIGLVFNKFDVNYKPIVTFAVEKLEEVVYSPIFLEMLKDEIAHSNKLEGELSKWKNASPEEIYLQLFPITLHLNTYYTRSDVYGYGYAGDNQIYINTKYLSQYSAHNMLDLMMIGSNLLHEHGHDCGFDHDFKVTARRPNSIAYILNRAYQRAFRKIYDIPAVPVFIKVSTPWYKRLWRKIWA